LRKPPLFQTDHVATTGLTIDCFCMVTSHVSVTGAEARAPNAGMEATTNLQKAGRAFLLRLVAEGGPQGAARVLRRLADEPEALEALARGSNCR
jgi:hypothetical protein